MSHRISLSKSLIFVIITVTLTSVTSVAPFEKEELEKMLDLVNNIEGSSGKPLRSQFTLLMLFMAGTVDESFAHTRCVVGMFIS